MYLKDEKQVNGRPIPNQTIIHKQPFHGTVFDQQQCCPQGQCEENVVTFFYIASVPSHTTLCHPNFCNHTNCM